MTVTELTPELIPAAARVHLDAFTGYMNAQLGRRYVERFLAWFARGDDRIALVARDGDAVVGYVVGAPVGYDRSMNRELFFAVARAFALRPWLLLQRRFVRAISLRLRRLAGRSASRQSAPAPSLAQPSMSLVGIGVASAARGKGAGAMLIDDFERRARLLGMRSVRLSVYATNAAARALYDRSGWRLLGEPDASGIIYYGKDLA